MREKVKNQQKKSKNQQKSKKSVKKAKELMKKLLHFHYVLPKSEKKVDFQKNKMLKNFRTFSQEKFQTIFSVFILFE